MASKAYKPAEEFHPGGFVEEELEERDWTQADLATITGISAPRINAVIKGKASVNVPMARAFSEAFGTSAKYWLNLQNQYDLWKTEMDEEVSGEIGRRALIYTFPLREMIKRNWVEETESLEVLENRVAAFFGSGSIKNLPTISVAARRSNRQEPLGPNQIAWLFRAKQLAEAMETPPYSSKKLKGAIHELRSLLIAPEATQEVPRILSDAGVKFVVVEGLTGLKADGVCFWLGQESPVVAMSLRLDRIDNFWFTLRHELEHVLHGHGKGNPITEARIDSTDTTLTAESEDVDEQEKRANEAAAAFCVKPNEVDDFIARFSPYYSRAKIEAFATRILNVHPGLLVGQLHRREDGLPYTHMRKLLVGVRRYVLETAMTDGWGFVPQP